MYFIIAIRLLHKVFIHSFIQQKRYSFIHSREREGVGSVFLQSERGRQKMGRTPCCEKMGLKKGPWTPEEDRILASYVHQHGHANWRALPKQAGKYIYVHIYVS